MDIEFKKPWKQASSITGKFKKNYFLVDKEEFLANLMLNELEVEAVEKTTGDEFEATCARMYQRRFKTDSECGIQVGNISALAFGNLPNPHQWIIYLLEKMEAEELDDPVSFLESVRDTINSRLTHGIW